MVFEMKSTVSSNMSMTTCETKQKRSDRPSRIGETLTIVPLVGLLMLSSTEIMVMSDGQYRWCR